LPDTRSRTRARALGLALSLLGALPVAAQVSPGPLSRAHRELEGNLNCLTCHRLGGDRGVDEPCLACHREIAWLIGRHRGYHGRDAPKDCAKCHPEHAGIDFDLVRMPGGKPDAFDHGLAGWPLTGRHARRACADCHGRSEFRVSPPADLSPRRQGPGRRWTGLDPACRTCHEDVHRGALGADCARCHETGSFSLPGFDHSKTAYPLTGKHAPVPCPKCHRAPSLALPVDREGRSHPLFKPLAHASCADCHRDPHAGRLGAACAHCHVEQGFRELRAGSFDHDRTRYPLRGRHTTTPCAKCHAPGGVPWVAKPAFDRCGACHADAHGGQATLAGQLADCAACHTVDGNTPSTFTVERHDASPYPLQGAHRKVRCASCHPGGGKGPGRAGVLLRPRRARCDDCHADVHAGQAKDRADGGDCGACHDTNAFRPSTWIASRHAETGFPLDGRHAAAACAACHGPSRPGLPALPGPSELGKAGVALRLPRDCAACHVDPHGGRFTAGGARPAPGGCAACHDATSFHPSRIDTEGHGRLGFTFTGAHVKVPCAKCHAELNAPPSPSSLTLAAGDRRPLVFGARRNRCDSCHADPHGGQFAKRSNVGACDSCHVDQAFRPAARFDHGRDTRFPLKGAHSRVPCGRCHPVTATPAPDGRRATVYAGTPTTCEGCHGSGQPTTPAAPRTASGQNP
jgi:hypothetical protein